MKGNETRIYKKAQERAAEWLQRLLMSGDSVTAEHIIGHHIDILYKTNDKRKKNDITMQRDIAE